MRKVIGLVLGIALLGGVADAAAQEYRALTRINHGAYIGIRYKSQRIVSSDRQQNKTSIVIDDVSKGSPAEQAGLRAGDEILRINGMSAGGGKFEAVARTLVEGDTVKLRVKRGNQEQEHTLVAAARPDHYVSMLGDRTLMFSTDSVRGLMKMYLDSARVHLDSLHLPNVWLHRGDSTFDIRIERFRPRSPRDSVFFDGRSMPRMQEFERMHELGPGVIFRSMEMGNRSMAGAELTELDPAMKDYFGTDRGLLVLRVAGGTPAARAGLQAGDVIVKANSKTVSAVPELRSMLLNSKSGLKLEIMRKGQNRTVEVQTQQE